MYEFEGYYLDGKTPVKITVSIKVTSTNLIISNESSLIESWPIEDILQTQGFYDNEPIKLQLKNGLSTVTTNDKDIISALKESSPEKAGKFSLTAKREKLIFNIVIGLIISSTFLYFLLTWVLPKSASFIAEKLPVQYEEKLGKAVVGQFELFGTCESKVAKDGVIKIINKLDEHTGTHPYDFKVYIMDLEMKNAFAAPGGYVAVTTGLLESSDTYDEVAGVLAHELTHVLKKHSTKNMIEKYTSTILLSLVLGDMTMLRDTINQLGAMNYSRTLESEADIYGLELIRKSKINHNGFITFFEKLAKDSLGLEDKMPESFKYFSTHPQTRERIEKLKELTKDFDYEPVELFSTEQWDVIKNSCKSEIDEELSKPFETSIN